MKPSHPQKITLTSSDNRCMMSVRIMEPLSGEANAAAAEDPRDKVLRVYPGAKITQEFSMNAGNAGGPAFDLRLSGSGDSGRMARVAFIPSAAGILEFKLESS